MKLCIIKAGSAIVTQNNNLLDLNAIQNICQQIIELNDKGWKVIMVSSGAVACGKGAIKTTVTKHKKINPILASLGQGKLISYYSSFINTNSSNLDVGQILMSRKSIANRENYNSLRDIILGMLEHNIVPIINENDALGSQGVTFSDNDQLTAIISVLVKAKCCVLLSSVGAIYNKNPNLYADAQALAEIDLNQKNQGINIDDSDSSNGGMTTKLDSFNVMHTFRSRCILIGKNDIAKLPQVIDGSLQLGTRLKPNPDKKQFSGLKRWLATAAIPKGMVIISRLGAKVMAGRTKKNTRSNLYSCGICGYFGQFDKGDVVSVRDEQLNLIGIGKSKCSITDLENKKCGSVFMRENEFFQTHKFPFIDSDSQNIHATLENLRKRLLKSDETEFTISPLGSDIDLSNTTLEAESIVIKRKDIQDLISLYRYAKPMFSVTFDEWLIYSALEGFYQKPFQQQKVCL